MKIGKDRNIRENKKKQQKKPNKNPDFFVIDFISSLIIILVGFFIGAILGWRIGGKNGGYLGIVIGSYCFFGVNLIVSKFVEPVLIKFIENSNKTVITALNLIFLFLYGFVSIGGGIILSWYTSGEVGKIFFTVSSCGLIVFSASVNSINVENK